MIAYVDLLLLMAEVKEGVKDAEGAMEDLMSAREKQHEILARLRTSEEANALEQRLVAAKLDHRIASRYLVKGESEEVKG